MFSGKSRPVPSKGALRVLYQLAYISSGTAVGVAALCAEERRRRTVVVQRIAENAKRLRQSPRHVHNAAVAVEDVGYAGEEEDVVLKRRTVKTASLPSEVERGYENLITGKKEKRTRGDRIDAEDGTNARDLKPLPALVRRHHVQERREIQNIGLLPGQTLAPRTDPSDDVRQLPLQGQPRRVSIPESEVKLSTQGRDICMLRQDVERLTRPSATERPQLGKAPDANDLLDDALRLASFDDVKQILDWKLSENRLTVRNVHGFCKATERLARATQESQLFAFWQHLLASENFRQLPLRTQVSVSLEFAGHAMDFRMTLDCSARTTQLLSGVIARAISIEADYITIKTEELCDTLLRAGRKGRNHASHILLAVAQISDSCQDASHELIGAESAMHKMFSSALLDRDYVFCSDLLLATLTNGTSHMFDALLQKATQHVDRKAAQSMLASLLEFEDHTESPAEKLHSWASSLSNTSRATLAMAFTLQNNLPWQLLESFYDSLPPENRQLVDTSLSHEFLHSLWKSGQNFDHVWTQYMRAKDFLRRMDSDTAVSDIDITMLEICNRAGQVDRALQLLGRISRARAHSSQSIAAAATTLSKQGVWSQVDQLLEVLSKSGRGVQRTQVSRNLHYIVQLYSAKHSVGETWDMVAKIAEYRDLKTSLRGITHHMLNLFVESGKIHLIPEWVKFLRSRGQTFPLSSKRALALLWTFYIKHRPRHTLLSELCRDLVEKVPSFDIEDFHPIVKEAVAYDVRHHSPSMRGQAEETAAHLLGAGKEPIENEFDHRSDETYSPFASFGHHDEGSQSLESSQPANEEKHSTATFACAMKEVLNTPNPNSAAFRRELERLMLLALSLNQYQSVFDLYHRSLRPSGLPASRVALEVVVEASLRGNKGEPAHAQEILDRARNAGMNVTSAMGPLLLHRMWRLPPAGKKDATRLRRTVVGYYRSSDLNGTPVKHFVGITAANVLINNGLASKAIGLLNSIYHSHWASERPLNMVAMTVYLKGYAATRSEQGVNWVFQKVLAENMRIDQSFLDTIKFVNRQFGREKSVSGQWAARSGTAHLRYMDVLKKWRRLCVLRRLEQTSASVEKGWELVGIIADLVRSE